MLHQIRKMISGAFDRSRRKRQKVLLNWNILGLVIAIVRGIASRDTIQRAYQADKVKIPPIVVARLDAVI